MGTKANPSSFDCYAKALPDEPMFVVLARDPDFFELVTTWADLREAQIERGNCPGIDYEMVGEAIELAIVGLQWRRENNGKWRITSAAAADLPAMDPVEPHR